MDLRGRGSGANRDLSRARPHDRSRLGDHAPIYRHAREDHRYRPYRGGGRPVVEAELQRRFAQPVKYLIYSHDPAVQAYVEDRLSKPVYKGSGEFHLSAAHADAPVVERFKEHASMNQHGLPHPSAATLNLPVFDGYPYLVVRLQPSFYHFSIVPGGRAVRVLRELARRQAQMNGLQACLALAPDSCVFYGPDGSESESTTTPRGGVVVSGILECAEEFPPTAELIERQLRLEAFVKSLKQKGYASGDLTKGGRDPNESQATRLTGRQPNGFPLGLTQCGLCREWRGECIDPNPRLCGFLNRTTEDWHTFT